MKKIISAILSILLCIALFVGCEDEKECGEPPEIKAFLAVVTEIDGEAVTVEPADGTPEKSRADRITFSERDVEIKDVCVGDSVLIEYTGEITDSYPARINVTKWYVIQEPYTDAKPVIYLYPEATTQVSVRLTLDGYLTCVYPEYSDEWIVTADPDGTLTDNKGQTYNYLYWEGESFARYDLSQGFCVKGEDTAGFLEFALERLGLTRREANEFIVYWLPLMQDNEYNVISFQGSAYTDSAMLDVTPMPDTVIRVFMAWQASDRYIDITPQQLTAPDRVGFTVVEWGGCEMR